MTKKEKEQLLQDEWPKKYPKGKAALLKAIKEASKSRIFDIEDEDEYLVIKK